MEKAYHFVAITDEYIAYLREFELHVTSNKVNELTYHRKYIGIIEKLGGFKMSDCVKMSVTFLTVFFFCFIE